MTEKAAGTKPFGAPFIEVGVRLEGFDCTLDLKIDKLSEFLILSSNKLDDVNFLWVFTSIFRISTIFFGTIDLYR